MNAETKSAGRGPKSRHPLSPQLNRKLDRYLLACSATSVAVLAAGTQDAKADIIYSGPEKISIPNFDVSGLYFDFDTGTVSHNTTAGADANLFDYYGTGKYNGQTAFYHA